MTYSRGKLTKYKLLAKSSELVPSLPKTRSLSKNNFLSLIEKYGEVIVKPSGGWGGVGVISVSSKDHKIYEIHYEKNRETIIGHQSTYSFIAGKTKGTSHIVQRKIPLAKVKGRPFDVRVMVQKKKSSSWVVTGKLAKVAGSGYIITNIARSKGKVVPLTTAIRESNIHGISASQVQSCIDRIALKAAKQLQKYYRINTVGLDIGIDSKGKVWIIEPNFKPDKSLFLKLKDKSMYRRIFSY
jgi:glutathione synthase/RimK-type ligase-like ATP-grasp enzyme